MKELQKTDKYKHGDFFKEFVNIKNLDGGIFDGEVSLGISLDLLRWRGKIK